MATGGQPRQPSTENHEQLYIENKHVHQGVPNLHCRSWSDVRSQCTSIYLLLTQSDAPQRLGPKRGGCHGVHQPQLPIHPWISTSRHAMRWRYMHWLLGLVQRLKSRSCDESLVSSSLRLIFILLQGRVLLNTNVQSSAAPTRAQPRLAAHNPNPAKRCQPCIMSCVPVSAPAPPSLLPFPSLRGETHVACPDRAVTIQPPVWTAVCSAAVHPVRQPRPTPTTAGCWQRGLHSSSPGGKPVGFSAAPRHRGISPLCGAVGFARAYSRCTRCSAWTTACGSHADATNRDHHHPPPPPPPALPRLLPLSVCTYRS